MKTPSIRSSLAISVALLLTAGFSVSSTHAQTAPGAGGPTPVPTRAADEEPKPVPASGLPGTTAPPGLRPPTSEPIPAPALPPPGTTGAPPAALPAPAPVTAAPRALPGLPGLGIGPAAAPGTGVPEGATDLPPTTTTPVPATPAAVPPGAESAPGFPGIPSANPPRPEAPPRAGNFFPPASPVPLTPSAAVDPTYGTPGNRARNKSSGQATAPAPGGMPPMAGNFGPATAVSPVPAPTGSEIIRQTKLRVLERYYEQALLESLQAEHEALAADEQTRPALEAKAKALQEFVNKLESELKSLDATPAAAPGGGSGYRTSHHRPEANDPMAEPLRPGGGPPPAVSVRPDPTPAIAGGPAKIFEVELANPVEVVACSPDGRRIAVATANGSNTEARDWRPVVEIFDTATQKIAQTCEVLSGDESSLLAQANRAAEFGIEALAFSPDGRLVAVGTNVGQVKIFDAQTGTLVRSLASEARGDADPFAAFPRAQGRVKSLAFSPDGKTLATCGEQMFPLKKSNEPTPLTLLVNAPGRLMLWDVATGTVKYDIAGHSRANGLAFSPDGRWLACAGSWNDVALHGSGVILWDARTGERARIIPQTTNGDTHTVAFSPDGKLLIASSRIYNKESDRLETLLGLYHTGSGLAEWQKVSMGWVNAKAFTHDGQYVVANGDGQAIRFLETGTGNERFAIELPADAENARWNDLAVATVTSRLAIGGMNHGHAGVLQFWATRRPGSAAANVLELRGAAGAGPSAPAPVILVQPGM